MVELLMVSEPPMNCNRHPGSALEAKPVSDWLPVMALSLMVRLSGCRCCRSRR